LGVEDLPHQGTGGAGIVDLWNQPVSEPISNSRAHLCPAHDSIFGHQVLGHGRRDLGHMVSVVLFTHSRFSVTTDCEAEKLLGRAQSWVLEGAILGGHFGNLVTGGGIVNAGL
jgi:hypothetical protein